MSRPAPQLAQLGQIVKPPPMDSLAAPFQPIDRGLAIGAWDLLKAVARRVVRAIESPDASYVVADLGTGAGDLAHLLGRSSTAPRIRQYIGVDCDPVVIDYASRHQDFGRLEGRVVLKCLDVQSGLTFVDESVDVICLATILNYGPEDDWIRELIEKCSRALKPGGRVICLELLPETHIEPIAFASGHRSEATHARALGSFQQSHRTPEWYERQFAKYCRRIGRREKLRGGTVEESHWIATFQKPHP